LCLTYTCTACGEMHCYNFIYEPAVHNGAHLASAPAEHQHNFHTLLRKCPHTRSVYVGRFQIRSHLTLQLDRQCSIAIMLSYKLLL